MGCFLTIAVWMTALALVSKGNNWGFILLVLLIMDSD